MPARWPPAHCFTCPFDLGSACLFSSCTLAPPAACYGLHRLLLITICITCSRTISAGHASLVMHARLTCREGGSAACEQGQEHGRGRGSAARMSIRVHEHERICSTVEHKGGSVTCERVHGRERGSSACELEHEHELLRRLHARVPVKPGGSSAARATQTHIYARHPPAASTVGGRGVGMCAMTEDDTGPPVTAAEGESER
eukprot:scaffold46455_cov20-Tisochrysis_lutea.AAC.1